MLNYILHNTLTMRLHLPLMVILALREFYIFVNTPFKDLLAATIQGSFKEP